MCLYILSIHTGWDHASNIIVPTTDSTDQERSLWTYTFAAGNTHIDYTHAHTSEKEKQFLSKAVKPLKWFFVSTSDLGLNWHNSADCSTNTIIIDIAPKDYVHGMQLLFSSFNMDCPWAVSIILCLWHVTCPKITCICTCITNMSRMITAKSDQQSVLHWTPSPNSHS